MYRVYIRRCGLQFATPFFCVLVTDDNDDAIHYYDHLLDSNEFEGQVGFYADDDQFISDACVPLAA